MTEVNTVDFAMYLLVGHVNLEMFQLTTFQSVLKSLVSSQEKPS